MAKVWTALLLALLILAAGDAALAQAQPVGPDSLAGQMADALRKQRAAAEAQVAEWRAEFARRDQVAARLERIAELANKKLMEPAEAEAPPPQYGAGPVAGTLSLFAALVALCVVTRKRDTPSPKGVLAVTWILIIVCLALLPFRAAAAEGDTSLIDDRFRSEVKDASELLQLPLHRRAVLACEALESGRLELPALRVSSRHLKPLASVTAGTPGLYFTLAALYLELGEEPRAEDNLARLLGDEIRYRRSEENDVVIAGIARHLIATDRRQEAGAFLANQARSVQSDLLKLQLATELDTAGVGEGIEALGLSALQARTSLAMLDRWGTLAAAVGSADLMKTAWRAAARELRKQGWKSLPAWLHRMEGGAVRGLRPEVLRFGLDLAQRANEQAAFVRSMLMDASISPSAEDYFRETAGEQSPESLAALILGAVEAQKLELATDLGDELRKKRRAALAWPVEIKSPVHDFAEFIGRSKVELSLGVLIGACHERLGNERSAGRYYINTVSDVLEQIVESHGLKTPLNIYDVFHLVAFLEQHADPVLRSELEVLLRSAASTLVFGEEARELEARLAQHHPEAAAWATARNAVLRLAAQLRPDELPEARGKLPERFQQDALEAIESVAGDLGVFSVGGPSAIDQIGWAWRAGRMVSTWALALLSPLVLLVAVVWLRRTSVTETTAPWSKALELVGVDVARTVILLPFAAVFQGAAWVTRGFQSERSEP